MIVQDIVDLSRSGALARISAAKDDKNMFMWIHLGVSMLYQRFNMSIKTEAININEATNIYELRQPDLGMVLGVYDGCGNQLRPSSVTDGVDYDYKQLTYRTFLFRDNTPKPVMFIYSASPPMFKTMEDVIDIPVIMIPALLDYVAYMGHSTVNTDEQNLASGYYQKFDKACQELEALGYKVILAFETAAVQKRGFI